MDNLIYKLNHVSYRYLKSVPVLSNINLSVFKGEKLVILGANGCGKSTLLKLLDGLIFPSEGRLEAFGQTIDERNLKSSSAEFYRKVGFVFQDSDTQLFCSSVFDEVAFAPLQLGLPRGEVIKQVDATLKDFSLGELKDRPPFQLSGGEKKKVALAAVTVYDPEILLLDEPTNGLDPRTKKWFLHRLGELNQHGTTIIVATHDLELGSNFADRVLVMNESHQIETIAKPEEVFAAEDLLLKVNLI